MTITEYADELAERIHAEGVDGGALQETLQLAVALWTDIARPDRTGLQWGLFATEVQTIAEDLFPTPPNTVIALDPAELDDDPACRAAMRQLIEAAARMLHTASRDTGQPRAWQYAHAAVALRAALGHLP